MKLSIMQPYFFPHIGYFQLINFADKFVVLDTVQFIRHGWIERNRILKQNGGWLYVKVPLKKHNRESKIQDIEIRDENWEQKILAQLQSYKKKAPFYNNVIELLNSTFQTKHNTITKLNFTTLKLVASYLGIKTPISIFSEMTLKIDNVTNAGEWALNISKAMNSDVYINPIGGKEIFNYEQFSNSNIKLRFLQTENISYNQKRNIFEEGLSIIDVMMFNSKDEIQEMLNKFTLL